MGMGMLRWVGQRNCAPGEPLGARIRPGLGIPRGLCGQGCPAAPALGAVGAEREMLARATWGSLGWGTAALELLGWKSSASCRECWRIPSGEVPVRKSPLDGAWRGFGAACAHVASHGFLER